MSSADLRAPKKRKLSSKQLAQGSINSSPRSSEKRRKLSPTSPSEILPEMEHNSEPLEPSSVSSFPEYNEPAIPVVSTAAASIPPARNIESLPQPASLSCSSVASLESEISDSARLASLASNEFFDEPVVSNNKSLVTLPSNRRFLHPNENVERLGKKPTRAQVVSITTNLLSEGCHYNFLDVIPLQNQPFIETLLMKQYTTEPMKMEECATWKSWSRQKFCQELLSAVPDTSVVRPDSATNFVELISQLPIQFSLENPAVEDAFDLSLQAIVHRFPDATPEMHLKAVKILTSRLPEQPINWRAILSRKINGKDVNLKTVNGFRLTWLAQLAKARSVREHAMEFGYEVNYTAHTRYMKDPPIKKKLPYYQFKTPTNIDVQKTSCTGCGRDYHSVAKCRFKKSEFFNHSPVTFIGSEAHKALLAKHPNAKVIPFTENAKDSQSAFSAKSSSEKSQHTKSGKSPDINSLLNTICNKNPENNFINVTVAAISQEANTTKSNVNALLDTGSLAGDFIANRVVQALKLQHFVNKQKSKYVCSGLDNKCYNICSTIALQVEYFSEKLNKLVSIKINPQVLDFSPIDLVIGRNTIRQYSIFSDVPSQLSTSSATIPCGCQPERIHVLEGAPKGSASAQKQDLAVAQTRGILASLLDKTDHLVRISAADIDEIEESASDSFLPWTRQFYDDDPLSKIHISGDEIQQKKIINLCIEFRDIFKNELDNMPAAIPPFNLLVDDLKWRVTSNRTPPRPQTTENQKEIVRQIKTLEEKGIIEKSQSAYYSQVLMVPKPDGTRRLCIDYRNLNDCTVDASWPIPNISDMLQRIGSQKPKIFGTMDLTQGYHQAPLTMQTRAFTSFIVFCGVYQFTRLPFGLKRAPSYFQEVMATFVLAGLIHITCEMYIDDCNVFGQSTDEFIARLKQIFERFRKYHVFLKASKCFFGYTEIDFVGKVISEEGLKMSRSKIQSVLDFPLPSISKQLKSFLGLVNYFRDFVRNHSNIVKPLHALLTNYQKSKKISWTEEAKPAFESIKTEIAKCTTMHFLNDTDPIFLQTDASEYGIGGYLFQLIDGKEVPIAFVSKSLSVPQLRWAIIQKEAYAIFYTCMHLKTLIRDRRFTLRTDHRNLLYISQNSNPMIVRWYMALSEYSFDLEYIKGENNNVADTMSRLCYNNMKNSPTEYSQPEIFQTSIIDKFSLTEYQYKTIASLHNSHVGHFGLERTLKRLKDVGKTWEFQRQHVRYFIDHCPCCQKMSLLKIPIHAHAFTTSTYTPMECLNIDFVGPFPDSGYVFVIIDTFTRWVELYHTLDATAISASKCLLQHFGRFGAPYQIRSDNGPHFVADVIREFLQLIGTEHCLTLAYSKEENALVERMNKEINRHLRALTFENSSLDNYAESLPFVQRILNSNYSDRLKISAAQLLFGNVINLDRGIFLPIQERQESSKPLSKHMSKMLAIQNSLLKAAAKELLRTDLLHMTKQTFPYTEFEPNSYVLVHYRSGAPPSRLHTFWRGPMKVISGSNSRYLLQDLVTNKEKEYHISDIKPFKFDPLKTNPLDVARRDHMEFFVETIIEHKGDVKNKKDLFFLVKWLTFDDSHNSWEPYSLLRDTAKLHEYLKNQNLKRLIPQKFKN
jgi:transposase InsO family protein